jgi:hypothetical protein
MPLGSKSLERIVGIADKWSGKLPRYHLPGDLLFAICGACGTERKYRQCRQDLREFSVDVRRSEAVTLRQPVMPVFDSFAG